jgi:hypothetical protein
MTVISFSMYYRRPMLAAIVEAMFGTAHIADRVSPLATWPTGPVKVTIIP